MDEKVNTYESEIKKLNSELHEKEIIAEKTKEYLFILDNQLNVKEKQIKRLTEDYNKQINKLKKEANTLKKENKKLSNEIEILKSTVSWKATKPLRKVKKLL